MPILGSGPLNYVLPLGNSLPGPAPSGYGDGNSTSPTLGQAGSGIYGTAYEVAAGLYRGLGYLQTGCDGVDNDVDGFVDNYTEGLTDPNTGTVEPKVPAPDNPNVMINVSALVSRGSANHTHVTWRERGGPTSLLLVVPALWDQLPARRFHGPGRSSRLTTTACRSLSMPGASCSSSSAGR